MMKSTSGVKWRVAGEGVADQVLAVPGDGRAAQDHPVAAAGVDLPQLRQDDLDGVALVGVVEGVEDGARRVDDDNLGGGGPGVDAEIGLAPIRREVPGGDAHGGVAGGEGVVIGLAGEERVHRIDGRGVLGGVFEQAHERVEVLRVARLGAQGRADGGEAVAVLREDRVLCVEPQGLHEPLPQALEEVERPAEEDDLPGQLAALGQTGDGLIDHGLEDGRSDVLLPPALVEDGLDVALGEDAAAGGDGIDLLVAEGQLVQLAHGDVEQGGHLVDEGPCAAGTGAVHAFLQGPAEEDDLGVLAAELDDGVGAGDEGPHRGGGGVDLLDEVQPGGLGHAEAGGAGDEELDLLAAQQPAQTAQGLTGALARLGIMPLVGAEEQFVVFVEHHDLDGGGTDVDADAQCHRVSPRMCAFFLYIK